MHTEEKEEIKSSLSCERGFENNDVIKRQPSFVNDVTESKFLKIFLSLLLVD